MMDIVYFTKGNESTEFRYSLRSLRNVPNKGRVVAIGPLPEWVQGVENVEVTFKHKWVALQEKFRVMCDMDLSKTVLMFENDMYVVKPRHEWPLVFHSTLDGMLQIRPPESGWWGRSVLTTKEYLEDKGVAVPMSYEAHVPVPVNRKEGAAIIADIPEDLIIRPHSLYGNLASKNQKRVLGNNAKAITNNDLVRLLRLDTPFLSSLDGSFELSRCRKALDLMGFKDKCEYER